MAASFVVTLTRTPIDIGGVASVMPDVLYSAQNISAPPATIYFVEGGATPSTSAPSGRLESGSDIILRYAITDPFWMWTDALSGAQLIFFETPS